MKCSYDRIIHEVYESLWSKNFLFCKVVLCAIIWANRDIWQKIRLFGVHTKQFPPRMLAQLRQLTSETKDAVKSKTAKDPLYVYHTAQCLSLVFQKNILVSVFKTGSL